MLRGVDFCNTSLFDSTFKSKIMFLLLFTALRFSIWEARFVGMNNCIITFHQLIQIKPQDRISDNFMILSLLYDFTWSYPLSDLPATALKEVLSTVNFNEICDQILAGHNF